MKEQPEPVPPGFIENLWYEKLIHIMRTDARAAGNQAELHYLAPVVGPGQGIEGDSKRFESPLIPNRLHSYLTPAIQGDDLTFLGINRRE